MGRRGWLSILVCIAAGAALACSDDADPRQEAPAQPTQAAVQQAQQQETGDRSNDAPTQQAESDAAQSEDGQQQASRPAMRSEQQDDPQQNDPYATDAAAPPPSIAEPREAITAGFPLIPSAPAEGDEYGWSAVVDDDIIAVGAPYHDDVADDAGAVFIFERNGDEWVEAAKLLPPFGEADGWFGRWLALDDGRLLIGAPYEDVTPATGGDPIIDTGAAYIYERLGGEWRRTATLLPEPLVPGASFGWSVAIDGDRLAVSAWADIVDEEQAGAVYVYREEKGQWRLEARVVPPEPQPAHQFGRDIELEENVLIVGAPGDDGEEPDQGAVFVYHQYDFDWNYTGKFIAPDGGEGDGLGTQVAMALPWFAAGAHGHDEDGWDAGVVYLWRLDEYWSLHTRLIPSDLAVGDWFGYSPALEGDRLVVGSPHRPDPETGVYRTGAAYLFELVDDEWTERGVLGPVDPALAGEKAEFGWAADIHGDTIVIGSWLADAQAGEDAGAAAAFLIAP